MRPPGVAPGTSGSPHHAASDRAAVRFRQDRHRRLRPRARRARRRGCCRPAAPRGCSPTPGWRSPRSPRSPASPEMLDGRVKTLHPRIHGGLLARRDLPEHMAALARARHRHDRPAGRQPVPVRAGHRAAPTARSRTRSRTSTSAARRCCARRRRTGPTSPCVIDPADYARVLDELRAGGVRREHAASCWRRRCSRTPPAYDGMISNYLGALQPAPRTRVAAVPAREPCPGGLHAAADEDAGPALRREPAPERRLLPRRGAGAGLLAGWTQLQGKALSLQQHRRRRRGLGMREDLRRDAGGRRLRDRQARQPVRRGGRRRRGRGLREGAGRPTRPRPSAASSPSTCALDGATAAAVAKQFVEVLIAPAISAEARAVFAAKQNVRLLEVPLARGDQRASTSSASAAACWCRAPTRRTSARGELRVVTQARARRAAQMDDLLFAWKVAKFVKSNAIVFCARRHDAGRRRRPDEPHRQRAHRLDQGRQRRAVAGRLGGRQRRLLPVPRRPRRGRRRRRRPA